MYMSEICIIVTIIVYLAAMLLVGFAYSKTNNDSADFYLGGRKMGPLVTAMSAEASDMSSCAGHMAQLAHRGPASAPLLGQPRRHHRAAVLVAPLP